MSNITRASLLLGAAVTMTAALLIFSSSGLPSRAFFSDLGFEDDQPIAPEIAALAPPFTLATLDGATLALTELRGDPVIINFWATWCGPCRIEMPYLQKIYDRHQQDGLRILAVNMGEAPNVIRPWIVENQLTFDIIPDQNQAIANLYRLRGQPSTYILGPDGVITDIFFGPVAEDELQRAIAPFVSG